MIISDFFDNQYGYRRVWGFKYRSGYVMVLENKIIIREFLDESLNAFTTEYTLPETILPDSIVLSEYSEDEFIITIFDGKSKSFKFLYFQNGVAGGFNYYTYEYDNTLFPDNPTMFDYVSNQSVDYNPDDLFNNELFTIPLSNAITNNGKLVTKMMLTKTFGETSVVTTFMGLNTSSTYDFVDIKSLLNSTNQDKNIVIGGVYHDYLGKYPYPNMVTPGYGYIGSTESFGNKYIETYVDFLTTTINSLDDAKILYFSRELLSDDYSTKIVPYDENALNYGTVNLLDVVNSGYDVSIWTEEYTSGNYINLPTFNYFKHLLLSLNNYYSEPYCIFRSNINSYYYANSENDSLDSTYSDYWLYGSGYTVNSSSDNEAYYNTLSYHIHIPFLWFDGKIRLISLIVSKLGIGGVISILETDQPNYYTYNIRFLPRMGYVILKDNKREIPAVIPLFVNDKYLYLAVIVTQDVCGKIYYEESIIKVPIPLEQNLVEYGKWEPFDIYDEGDPFFVGDNGSPYVPNQMKFFISGINSDDISDYTDFGSLTYNPTSILYSTQYSNQNEKPLSINSKPALYFTESNTTYISNKIQYTTTFVARDLEKVCTSPYDVIK